MISGKFKKSQGKNQYDFKIFAIINQMFSMKRIALKSAADAEGLNSSTDFTVLK